MKRIVYLLLFTSMFLSCKSKTADSDQDTTAINKPLDQSQSLIHQFKPVINGIWLKKDYIKKVQKSKSPNAAMVKANGITVMRIDTNKLNGDSIPVPAIWNNREASTLVLKFQPGRNSNTLELGNDELSYTIKNNDTTLTVYHYNAETKETLTSQYIKLLKNQPVDDMGHGLNYIINQSLISGNYQGTDARGKTMHVKFSDNGMVAGLPGLSSYFVQINYVTSATPSHDEMIFNQNSKGQKSYVFSINKRILSLYDNADALNANKPSFTLKKKRQ